jgi:osmoprotectant transport system permease protein
MGLVVDVVNWFRDVANWEGSDGALERLREHVSLSATATIAAILIALPLAVWLGHHRRFGTLAVNVSNVGRAVPSIAILAVGTQLWGIKDAPVIQSVVPFIALVALAVPPIVTNAYVGMAEVDDDIRESARGMGLSGWQSLRHIELPLAVPLIMAGIRTSAVQVVATATIAAQVGAGGLGRLIIDGFAVQDNVQLLAGAVLVAALSFLTEVSLGALQRRLTPKGLRGDEVVVGGVALDPADEVVAPA